VKLYFFLVPWIPVLAALFGAFLGAVMAFYVSQANEVLKRNRERWKEHWDALVRLENWLNEILGLLADNRHTARDLSKSPSREEDEISLVWSEPQTIPRAVFSDTPLLRLELINQLFSFRERLRKLNSDTMTIRRAYTTMRSAFLNTRLDPIPYRQSVRDFRSHLKVLLKHYDLLDDRTLSLLVATRVAMDHDKRYNKKLLFKMPNLTEITDSEKKNMRELVIKEIEKVQSKSRAEIERFAS